METATLTVRFHAIRQFMRRFEGKTISDDCSIQKEVKEQYNERILKRLARGIELSPSLCTLFVKVSRDGPNQHKQSLRNLAFSEDAIGGTTGWGSFVYDGDAVYVVQDNSVVTIIRPTHEQHKTLDAALGEKLQAKAISMDKRLLPAEPFALEIMNTANLAISEVQAWIARANPSPAKPVRLVTDHWYRTLPKQYLSDIPNNAKDIVILQDAFFRAGQKLTPWSSEENETIRIAYRAMIKLPEPIAHAFVLCRADTLKPFLRILGRIRQASVDEDAIANADPKSVFTFQKNEKRSLRFQHFHLP